jgi:hypothetical protein
MWIDKLKFMTRMNQKLFPLILVFVAAGSGQPKLHVQLGGGYYQPTLTALNTVLGDSSFFSNNVLLNFTATYQVYYNTRVGFGNWNSFHNVKDSFKRRIAYKALIVETFYYQWKDIEFNFLLAPMWNSCIISMGIDNENADWSNLLSSFGNTGTYTFKSTAIMNTSWFGFTSSIGIRYYSKSWLGLDLRIGFTTNFYDKTKWKYEGETITGPAIKLNAMPLFRFGVVFAK